MTTTIPQASFSPTGPQTELDAAFACPECAPGQAGIPRLVASKQRWSWETFAHCRCTTCGHTWTMRLDLAQTIRLTHVAAPRVPDDFAVKDPFSV